MVWQGGGLWYRRPETAVSKAHRHAGRRQGATLTLRIKKVIPANMRTLLGRVGEKGERRRREVNLSGAWHTWMEMSLRNQPLCIVYTNKENLKRTVISSKRKVCLVCWVSKLKNMNRNYNVKLSTDVLLRKSRERVNCDPFSQGRSKHHNWFMLFRDWLYDLLLAIVKWDWN